MEVIIDAAASHEFEDNAQIRLLGTGSNELHHVLVPDLPHYRHFLQVFASCLRLLAPSMRDIAKPPAIKLNKFRVMLKTTPSMKHDACKQ